MEPTPLEQAVGIMRAFLAIVTLGWAATAALRVGQHIADEWPLTGPEPYRPGLFEPNRWRKSGDEMDIISYSIGVLASLAAGMVVYLSFGGYFLAATVTSQLVFGNSLPSYPLLYFGGALALLAGLQTQHRLDNYLSLDM